MKNWFIYFTLNAVVFLAGNQIAEAKNYCNHYLTKQITDVFRKTYNSKQVSGGQCFFNSGDFAKTIIEKLGTKIDDKDLFIFVIKNKKLVNPFIHQSEVELSHAILGLKPKQPTNRGSDNVAFSVWKYHAVIEYKGRIFDFDLKDADIRGAVPANLYFEEMFPTVEANLIKQGSNKSVLSTHNLYDELEVLKIPAKEYMSEVCDRKLYINNEKSLNKFLSHKKISLDQYLSDFYKNGSH